MSAAYAKKNNRISFSEMRLFLPHDSLCISFLSLYNKKALRIRRTSLLCNLHFDMNAGSGT